MAIRLLLNDNAIWTDGDFKYYSKYQRAFQNINKIDIPSYIASNLKRADGMNTHFYEIYNDNERVGDILLTKVVYDEDAIRVKDMGWEIDIGIYDSYQDKGYGQEAIERLFEMKYLNNLFVCINPINPLKARIEHMLKKLGFAYDGICSDYWIKELQEKVK